MKILLGFLLLFVGLTFACVDFVFDSILASILSEMIVGGGG